MILSRGIFIFFFSIFMSDANAAGGIDQIKEVLIKDKLIKEADQKKIEELKKEVVRQKKIEAANSPVTEEEFWSLVTHLWLVKRESRLRWDFEKVDYGVNQVFQSLLKKLNISGSSYKILYLNSDVIPHVGIPTGNEYILLISKPFIEKLDLSKQEIALILFDEYVRLKLNTLMNKVNARFNNLGAKKTTQGDKTFEPYLSVLDQEIFVKGFSFQNQFNLTKEVVTYLKNDNSIAQIYHGLNDKIKNLVQSEQQYAYYPKIYPSPDLKETWLNKLLPNQKL